MLIDVVGVGGCSVSDNDVVDEEVQTSRIGSVNLGAKLKALSELLSFRANAIATELAGPPCTLLDWQLQLHLVETD